MDGASATIETTHFCLTLQLKTPKSTIDYENFLVKIVLTFWGGLRIAVKTLARARWSQVHTFPLQI
jgi:hypothetical protein